MIRALPTDEDRRKAAADWVVRLQDAGLDEADALAFDAWLSESPANAAAYDAALAVWREVEARSGEMDRALQGRRVIGPRAWIGLAAGAAAAAAVTVGVLPSLRSTPAPPIAYVTAPGQHRSLTLADGTRIDLNGATRLTVALHRRERDVRLDGGEAVFDVAHDPARPFVIAAGDRFVRVVGTQFDVRRRDGRLAVTVTRGTVEVAPAAGAGTVLRLHPGQRMEHVEGAQGATLSTAPPDEALGWRSGRLVYRNQPLSEVVADLNAQFQRPIRIEGPALAAAPISGVLILDNEDAVVRRLALLVSARAVPSPQGVTLQPVETPAR